MVSRSTAGIDFKQRRLVGVKGWRKRKCSSIRPTGRAAKAYTQGVSVVHACIADGHAYRHANRQTGMQTYDADLGKRGLRGFVPVAEDGKLGQPWASCDDGSQVLSEVHTQARHLTACRRHSSWLERLEGKLRDLMPNPKPSQTCYP